MRNDERSNRMTIDVEARSTTSTTMAPRGRSKSPSSPGKGSRSAAKTTKVTAASTPSAAGLAVVRDTSRGSWLAFSVATGLSWGAVAVLAVMFYLAKLDFATSSKIGLYIVSVWLNSWSLPLLLPGACKRPRSQLKHECLTLWTVSYTMTNVLWEVPWMLFGPRLFNNLNTLADVEAQTDYMRSSPFAMGMWVLSSFSSVDLRTVNHNGTFYSLECYAYVNIAASFLFFHLNKKRSQYRYLIPVVALSTAPAIATFIFTFSEVFDGYANMATSSVADALLALVWTQYQYVFFPLLLAGYWGSQLLIEDLKKTK